MKTRSITALLLALVFTALTACTTGQPSGSTNGAKKIGVVQLISHNALDAAYNGFVAALAENGFNDGEEISIDFHNALGEISNLSTISDRFVADNVDLVLAIATPSVQAIASKTTTIPILGTAVTDYVSAELIESDEKPGANVSGTSDMNPVAAQVGIIPELVPDCKTVGFIYNSGEANSVLQIEIAKEAVQKLGLEFTEVTVTNTNDVLQAMQSLVRRCDAIYIPTDNIVASAMATVHSVTIESGTPTICGESNMVLEGGLISMGIDYFDLGFETGLMAIEVLNGANPAEMPIRFSASSENIVINGEVLEEIGLELPEKYKDFVIFPEE